MLIIKGIQPHRCEWTDAVRPYEKSQKNSLNYKL